MIRFAVSSVYLWGTLAQFQLVEMVLERLMYSQSNFSEKIDHVVSVDKVIGIYSGGFLLGWLPASSAMMGLTVSMPLGYPS